MIRTLRKRMILLTVIGLFLASAIMVAVIYGMNQRSLADQAEAVLAMLAENGGQRPARRNMTGSTPPAKPDNTPSDRPDGKRLNELSGVRGREARSAADLSNYYLVYLTEDGAVKSWESDRAELYSDEQISVFTAEALATCASSGRVGQQFFRRSGDLLIVVDATLDFQNASQYLRTTLLVALIQWALLSAGAVWLIRRMVRPVDEAMEKQRQFVWDASHELKTPLAVISANAEVLSSEVENSQPLQYIQSEVKRTDQLVQNLLTLARMEKDAGQARHEKFDLSRALLSVALPFESAVFEAGKEIELRIPDGVSYTGSEEMIKQLTMILLSNAVKYSDEHGKIALALEAKGDKRIIRVHNTGPAIPREYQEKIFDRFFRVDSSHNREIPGNGLGLAIAKNIAEIHRGRITVQSEEGKGTEFTVFL